MRITQQLRQVVRSVAQRQQHVLRHTVKTKSGTPKDVDEEIARFATFNPTALSLQSILEFGEYSTFI